MQRRSVRKDGGDFQDHSSQKFPPAEIMRSFGIGSSRWQEDVFHGPSRSLQAIGDLARCVCRHGGGARTRDRGWALLVRPEEYRRWPVSSVGVGCQYHLRAHWYGLPGSRACVSLRGTISNAFSKLMPDQAVGVRLTRRVKIPRSSR